MILADKIIELRKKNGWSQEELAEKMNVSRQAVSKWEAAQTTPDLEKILALGSLFGVTTDYLLKDELEDEVFTQDQSDSPLKCVTMEEANGYMETRRWASSRIALATLLCILSPICLLIMGAVQELPDSPIAEDIAGVLGLGVLLLLVAVAVAIYIFTDAKNSPYTYLDQGEFELAYGVSGMVKERQKKFRDTYVRSNIIGTCLCILAPVILLSSALTDDDVIAVFALCLMLAVVGVAVVFFITVGVQWASMERLLGEGDYSRRGKKRSKLSEAVSTVYWCLTTAVYLGWSFWTNDWGTTWVIWPVAGVLFAAVLAVVSLVDKEKEK